MNKNVKNYKIVPMSQVSPNRWNYNEQTKEMFEKTKLSIHHQGFVEAIIVRRIGQDQYEIVDGEHRWLACKALEFENIFVNDLGEVSDEDLKLEMITSNETHGESNDLRLSQNMVSIAELGYGEFLKETFPRGDDEFSRLMKLQNFSWEDLKPDEREVVPVEHPNLQTYTFSLPAEKMELVKSVLSKLMDDTSSKIGRAFELLCAEYLSGLNNEVQ